MLISLRQLTNNNDGVGSDALFYEWQQKKEFHCLKRKNAQERVAVPVMMDGFPVGVEIDGEENRRGREEEEES